MSEKKRRERLRDNTILNLNLFLISHPMIPSLSHQSSRCTTEKIRRTSKKEKKKIRKRNREGDCSQVVVFHSHQDENRLLLCTKWCEVRKPEARKQTHEKKKGGGKGTKRLNQSRSEDRLARDISQGQSSFNRKIVIFYTLNSNLTNPLFLIPSTCASVLELCEFLFERVGLRSLNHQPHHDLSVALLPILHRSNGSGISNQNFMRFSCVCVRWLFLSLMVQLASHLRLGCVWSSRFSVRSLGHPLGDLGKQSTTASPAVESAINLSHSSLRRKVCLTCQLSKSITGPHSVEMHTMNSLNAFRFHDSKHQSESILEYNIVDARQMSGARPTENHGHLGSINQPVIPVTCIWVHFRWRACHHSLRYTAQVLKYQCQYHGPDLVWGQEIILMSPIQYGSEKKTRERALPDPLMTCSWLPGHVRSHHYGLCGATCEGESPCNEPTGVHWRCRGDCHPFHCQARPSRGTESSHGERRLGTGSRARSGSCGRDTFSCSLSSPLQEWKAFALAPQQEPARGWRPQRVFPSRRAGFSGARPRFSGPVSRVWGWVGGHEKHGDAEAVGSRSGQESLEGDTEQTSVGPTVRRSQKGASLSFCNPYTGGETHKVSGFFEVSGGSASDTVSPVRDSWHHLGVSVVCRWLFDLLGLLVSNLELHRSSWHKIHRFPAPRCPPHTTLSSCHYYNIHSFSHNLRCFPASKIVGLCQLTGTLCMPMTSIGQLKVSKASITNSLAELATRHLHTRAHWQDTHLKPLKIPAEECAHLDQLSDTTILFLYLDPDEPEGYPKSEIDQQAKSAWDELTRFGKNLPGKGLESPHRKEAVMANRICLTSMILKMTRKKNPISKFLELISPIVNLSKEKEVITPEEAETLSDKMRWTIPGAPASQLSAGVDGTENLSHERGQYQRAFQRSFNYRLLDSSHRSVHHFYTKYSTGCNFYAAQKFLSLSILGIGTYTHTHTCRMVGQDGRYQMSLMDYVGHTSTKPIGSCFLRNSRRHVIDFVWKQAGRETKRPYSGSANGTAPDFLENTYHNHNPKPVGKNARYSSGVSLYINFVLHLRFKLALHPIFSDHNKIGRADSKIGRADSKIGRADSRRANWPSSSYPRTHSMELSRATSISDRFIQGTGEFLHLLATINIRDLLIQLWLDLGRVVRGQKARNHSRVSLPLARASRVRFVENEQRPTRKYSSLRKLAEASMDRKVLDLAQADEVAPGSIGGLDPVLSFWLHSTTRKTFLCLNISDSTPDIAGRAHPNPAIDPYYMNHAEHISGTRESPFNTQDRM
ncbi:hypothetical protein VP01_1511g1 [Puccinia sorghi]|uniref:Uncharacterized protein n=1 Tax=Puccinia sorghi TaxID=27349 RepID=A0A0L6VJ29_9BASI|nr:hypothetical protein VP01_1511g1 [Puccinia sorghi]